MGKLLFFIALSLISFNRQPTKRSSLVIAFYNLENLYDTIDNPMVGDDEFTPQSAKQYNTDIYRDKLFKLATVIKDIGIADHPTGAAILGVAEIENDTVLYHLVRHFLLRDRKLKIVHFDSKDARGIDVGLLYNPALFIPHQAMPLKVDLPGRSKEAYYTRDILYVKGNLMGEPVHIYVNHWPSRRGGEVRSAPARAAAAIVCRKHIDSILQQEPFAKMIVMGDLNDNPVDRSIRKQLNTSGNLSRTQPNQLFNPWEQHYNKGYGTLANKDIWGLFDQILLSYAFTNSTQKGWQYQKSVIYSKPFMVENTGRYMGYPMRTWDGDNYRGGFSDHFPTYIVLKREQ